MAGCWNLLTCPVCGLRLFEAQRSLQCARGHTFDRAREGYVNLLTAGHGQTKIHGDTSEMLQARRRILGRGYYEPLSARLNQCGVELLAVRRGDTATIMDVGCGEGYYLGRLSQLLQSSPLNDSPAHPHARAFCFFGMDVSKDALRMAARTYKSVSFFVGDARHHIRLGDGSVDLLLNIFAPRNAAEFERVLRPDGSLLIVIPREHHLTELRSELSLLRIDADKQERVEQQLRHRFQLVAQDTLEYRVDIDRADVVDFLYMTPNYWHLDEATVVRASALGSIHMTMGMSLLRFRPARGRA